MSADSRTHPQVTLTLLAIAGILLAACAPATPGATPATSTPSARVARLTVAIPQDEGPLNVYTTFADRLVELVYDKLFAPSPYVDAPQPWLAEKATQLDPSTWLVYLRPGISWQDGRPFTAEDVKFTFDAYREGVPTRWTHHVAEVPRIARIEVEDPLRVRFVCAYPCPSLARITFADLPILPQHVWKSVREPGKFTDLPIGTGPYRLVEYKADQAYRFQANESYFKGRPTVDELVMPIIKDPTTAFTALKSGQVDAVARMLPAELIADFKRLSDLKIVATAPLAITELRLNYGRVPFNDPDFRRALSLAIDRQALVDTVLLGRGRPGTRGYPHPDSPWTKPDLSTPFDAAQATRILDNLGFVDRDGDGVRETSPGRPLTFTVKVTASEPAWIRAAELVAKQLAVIGVRLTVQPLDTAAVAKLFSSRDFDLALGDIGPHGVADPDQFIMSHRSGYLWSPKLPYPEFERLFEAWRQTTTVEARKQVSFQMQELFNRQPTSIALWYPEENWAFRPKAFDRWAESPGYGIVHKWSFLPKDVRRGAVSKEFE